MSAALEAPVAEDPVDELYDPEAWDRWASEMQRVVAFHLGRDEHNKAAYYRPFIARFAAAAARLRRQA